MINNILRRPPWRTTASSIAVGLALSACAVGPDFHAPEAPQVADASHPYTPAPLPAMAASDPSPAYVPQRFVDGQDISASWWEAFQSPPLNALVQSALQHSPTVAAAQATLRQAEENFKRIDQLSSKAIATERQLDDAVAQRDQARASVQLAEAEIRNARLNLDYTTVVAPASGVTALQSPPVGTLIQAQQTLLTTITRLDPAYVMFSFTDTEAQDFRELNQRRAKPIVAEDLTVELHYSNGAIYPHTGKIDQAAQRVDLQTGTIEARAIFPNPDGALIPGQFVRIVIKGVTLQDAIVIPSQAINQGPQGPSVFVVGENNAAQAKLVRLGQEVAGGLVVQNGLKSGERVIVEGVIRVRPGAPVKPVPMSPPPSTQTTPASAANTEGARP